MNLLSRQSPTFPPVDHALEDPNGLLAVGGALTMDWLTMAYERGIFPWFDSDEGPILWWSPDPRAVLLPDGIRITRSLVKRLRNAGFSVTADRAFATVVAGCAQERRNAPREATGTWITDGMMAAYQELHGQGLAHSIEVWQPDATGKPILVGGLYGVSIGRMFFGESMFSRQSNASKFALYALSRYLQAQAFALIDCQVLSHHLTTVGASLMPRAEFADILQSACEPPEPFDAWPEEPLAVSEIDTIRVDAALQ